MPTHPIIVSEDDIMPLLTDPAAMDDAIQAVEKSTIAEYAGRVRSQNMIDRTQTEPSNLLQIHMATDDELVTGFQVFGATPGQPRSNSRFVVLLDGESRQFMGIVPYEGLSPLRVGASAGVAARYLAPKGARSVAMIGSSKQARRQLHAIVRAVPSVKEARVYSPTPENRQVFAAEMSDFLGIEVPAEVLQQRIVVPTWDSTLDEATGREPFGSAIRKGTLKREDVSELGQVILGEVPARERDDQTVVFDVGRINIWAVAVTH